MNAQGTASQRACKVMVRAQTQPRRRQVEVERGRRSSRAFAVKEAARPRSAEPSWVLVGSGESGEGEETHAPFNHGLGGLRASSNGCGSFKHSTSTPCGPHAVWLGPTERWREAKHGRPPLPVFDAPPVLRTCWQRSQHARRRYAGLRYTGCRKGADVTM